ncbi:hypothetical protein PP7435_CHR2-0023 [Komagataella phaffii CBS 7435]|uniref:Acetyl-CoA transporter n=2 Tax=Komagataella phaffii TaxID=460519 RepID=C4R336_KOMPG|nr:Putative protein, acetyl coenzyme A transporter [Komagataella phaffii GS115]AOA62977.1 GQ67_01331T0 [Komagataella phaffii]CAH2447527.1 hypothetical protein BQ9382_C2-0120 [Komagataella phaffii CBS 7435]AOA67009.1 GQ68_00059T0 [Komagataella phaffii GS115]CAY69910.1 Putative protein, acetyl coenzyme A transporter [Komagataella phaffii GS115]CCA37722.1 hypothetical protein PP7435_CHR2-0023 [Komagataella phaffii CBS 7435]
MTSEKQMSLDVSSSHRHEDGSVALPKIGSTPSPSCQYKEGTFSAYEDEIVNELDFRQIEDTETSGNLPVIDRPQFALLVMLYLIQGVPIGLAFGTIPFLLKGSNLSFSQVGVFSLASYPYSLKLLWSPIVDSLYFKNIGRRRSWIIPVQAVSGLMLLFLSTQVDALFLDLEANLYRLTIVFFILILLCATQDIAVDGWALTILSPSALSYASTAQTIGLNTGYFMSFTIFLAFNSPDFANKYFRKVPSDVGPITLSGYLYFFGWIFLSVTVFLWFKVPEQPAHLRHVSKKHDEEEAIEMYDLNAAPGTSMTSPFRDLEPSSTFESLVSVYKKMIRVLQLPNVKLFVVLHLISKIGFQVNDGATNLKLLEKGFTKEDLAIAVLIDFPFELVFGYYTARWSAGEEPLKPWRYGYIGRLIAAMLGQLLVWSFPSGGVTTPYFFAVISQHLLGSFMSTVQFVSICAFHTQIADPTIGGTYMTTLNTLANLGGQWPKIIVFTLIDKFTKAKCILPATVKEPTLSQLGNTCANAHTKELCQSVGGKCQIITDGYFATNVLCIAIGFLLYFGWIKRTANHLQSLPSTAWRVHQD